MGIRKNGLARVTPGHGPTIEAWRALTEAELAAWYDSDAAKGMNCAGESKLPPRRKRFELEDGEIVTVLKGRTAWAGDWGRPVRNCAVVMTRLGEVLYTKRQWLLEA